MATRTLLVCGGSGFLGTRICALASARNWRVTSLSRTGEPTWPTPRPDWASKITWARGDVLNPSTYAPAIAGADAVVHTMGILLEADYKGVLAGKEPLVAGLKKAFNSTRMTGRGGLSYETMNRDTAVTLAEEAVRHRAKTFLYVSAIDSFFVLPERYITTKREAEGRIVEIAGGRMREVRLRPSFMYDSSRAATVPLAVVMGVTSMVNGLLGGKVPFLGAAGHRPLGVEEVAGAAVKALEDEGVSGVVDVEGIRELGMKVWREGMI